MTPHSFIIVGADTDGLAFKKPDESMFTPEESEALLSELNSQMEGLIKWENDGLFPRQLVIKTKNYVLVDGKGKRKIKGSALKATTKEKRLKAFVEEVVDCFLADRPARIMEVYFSYAREILNIKDMSGWCSKKTITKAVLTNTRTQEKRIREAIKGRPVQEGDKIYTFFKTSSEVSLLEDFTGEYDASTLLGKLYDTLCIFETVLDVKQFPNLTLKRNVSILNGLRGT